MTRKNIAIRLRQLEAVTEMGHKKMAEDMLTLLINEVEKPLLVRIKEWLYDLYRRYSPGHRRKAF